MSRLNRLNLLNKYSAGALPWTDFWVSQTIFYELWDLRKKNDDGGSTGLIRGDILTITGTLGNETYQVPNIVGYRTSDTENLWFTPVPVRRSVTTEELRSYDFQRTIIRYLSEDPFTIEAIGILNPAAVITNLSDELLTKFYNDFRLNPWWNGEWIDAGETKENRAFEQTLWVP
jgi:hypothetical protein